MTDAAKPKPRAKWRTTATIVFVALAVAAMFTASWLNRQPNFAAMTQRDLVLYLNATQTHNRNYYREAVREYNARPQQDRWDQLQVLLSDQDPNVRSAAADALYLEGLRGDELNDTDSAVAARAMQLRQLLDDDVVSLKILIVLTSACDAQGWKELPNDIESALRRHLTARSPQAPDSLALFCVMRFGRLCLPLQSELLAIDANIADPNDASFLAAALGAIAWNNAAVVDRLVTLLGPRHERSPYVISGAADALSRCGEAAAVAAPRLLQILESRQAIECRANAALALAQITRDPDVAARALGILLRDRDTIAGEREREWILAASRLAARAPASPSAEQTLQALQASPKTASEFDAAATYGAAIALVTAAQGDDQRSQAAAAAVVANITTGMPSPDPQADGDLRHSLFGAAIELLINLHQGHPDAKIDLQTIRAQLDSFATLQTTSIRDWAHHQHSRLGR